MTAPLPMLPGPSSASCCAPAAGLDPRLDADRIAAVAKALSEPLRVQVLDVLRRNAEPVCQCELIARRHKWAYYSVPTDVAKELTSWLS